LDYSTQSYTGYEPTTMRAIRARYGPLNRQKDVYSSRAVEGSGTRRRQGLINLFAYIVCDSDVPL